MINITKEEFYVIALESMSLVIKFEEVFKKEGLTARTIPTPSEVSSGCGISLKVETAEIQKAGYVLKQHQTGYRCFMFTKEGLQKSAVEKRID